LVESHTIHLTPLTDHKEHLKHDQPTRVRLRTENFGKDVAMTTSSLTITPQDAVYSREADVGKVISAAEEFAKLVVPKASVPIENLRKIAEAGWTDEQKLKLSANEGAKTHEMVTTTYCFQARAIEQEVRNAEAHLNLKLVESKNELKKHPPILCISKRVTPKIPFSIWSMIAFAVFIGLLVIICAFEYTTLKEYIELTRYRFFRGEILKYVIPVGAIVLPLSLSMPIANKLRTSKKLERYVIIGSLAAIFWYVSLVYLIGMKMAAPAASIMSLSSASVTQVSDAIPGFIFAACQVTASTTMIAFLSGLIINKWQSHFPESLAENPIYNQINSDINELSELKLRAANVIAVLQGRLAEVSAYFEGFVIRCTAEAYVLLEEVKDQRFQKLLDLRESI